MIEGAILVCLLVVAASFAVLDRVQADAYAAGVRHGTETDHARQVAAPSSLPAERPHLTLVRTEPKRRPYDWSIEPDLDDLEQLLSFPRVYVVEA